MGQIQSFEELISFLLRRKLVIIAVTVLGILAAAVFAKTRPDAYEAAAVIQVEMPAITGAPGQPTTSGAAQVLQSIEQRLTTRENLAAVIERHGLFADAPALSQDEKMALLRGSISFQGIDSAAGQAYGQPRLLSAIVISARMGDGELAARVANDFAQGVLDQSASGQRDKAAQNVAFFTEEEARIWAQLSALEAEIAAYKNDNAAALPTQGEAMRDEISALDTDLRRIDQERVAAERDAAAVRARENLRETDRRQLDDITARIEVLEAQRAASEGRRAELMRLLAATPEVERVLSGYTRQLTQLQDRYEVVTRRLSEAETELRLADRQQTERFTLLDRAITPEHPVGNSGKKLVMAGAVGSVLAGLALAFLLELMNPVVRTATQMERQLDLRPVISIPEVTPQKPRRGGRDLLRLIDDPTRYLMGLPRYAVVAAAATLMLVAAAAIVA